MNTDTMFMLSDQQLRLIWMARDAREDFIKLYGDEPGMIGVSLEWYCLLAGREFDHVGAVERNMMLQKTGTVCGMRFFICQSLRGIAVVLKEGM